MLKELKDGDKEGGWCSEARVDAWKGLVWLNQEEGWVGWWIVGSKSDRLPPREDEATSLPGSRSDLSRESSSFLSRIFLFKRDGDAGVRRWNDRMYHRMIYYRWLSSSDHLASAAVFNPLRLYPLAPSKRWRQPSRSALSRMLNGKRWCSFRVYTQVPFD